MRTITNHYEDAQVLNLGSETDRGPFLVIQQGTAPNDQLLRKRLFVLRPDGLWADFNAYAAQGKPECMDEIVFPTIAKVLETFSTLVGKPQIATMPVDEAGLKAWLAKQETTDPVQNAHSWAMQYRGRHCR